MHGPALTGTAEPERSARLWTIGPRLEAVLNGCRWCYSKYPGMGLVYPLAVLEFACALSVASLTF